MRRALVVALAAAFLLAPAVVSAAPGGRQDSVTLRQLAALRRTTTAYRNVTTAVQAGFVPVGGCVEVPGLGGMGVHHANFARFDTTVDALQPEGLLYDHSSGRPRLVAVEYLAVYVGQPAPVVLGQTMMGPMEGHEPGMPTHYDLHVWAWQGNPSGIFAEFNPNVTC